MANAVINPNHLLPLLQCYAAAAALIVVARMPRWWRALRHPGWTWSLARAGCAVFGGVLLTLSALVLCGYHLTKTQGISMMPTLTDGELLVCDGNAFGWHWPFSNRRIGAAKTPARGDIVTVYHAAPNSGQPVMLVKRVIGLPGDTIQARGGRLWVNGVEEKVVRQASGVQRAGGHAVLFDEANEGMKSDRTWKVGPGEVFLVGDHRDRSWDSRAWGPLPINRIASRVVGVFQSWGWLGPDVAFAREHS